jgi:hypothetical protein
MSRTFMVPVIDNAAPGAHTVTLTLSAAGGGGLLGTQTTTAVLTISECAGCAGLTAAYVPAELNDTWSYDGTSTGVTGSFFDTIRVTGSKVVLGVNTQIFLEDNPEGSRTPTENYYRKDVRAFTFFGNNDSSDPLTPAVVPYDEMIFGVRLNSTLLFNETGRTTHQDLDGDGRPETVDARGVASFVGLEKVTTAAGTFSAAAHVSARINLAVHFTAAGSVTGTETINQWLVPDVGKVKEVTTTNINSRVRKDTLDIRGFRVNGVGAGYLAPLTLVSDLAHADSDTLNPGHHAVGSDGTDFLLVTRQQTNIPNVPSSYKWTARIIGADGTVHTPVDLSGENINTGGEAAVGFDGNNYLVLTNTAAGNSGASGLVAQRVSTAGTLLDAPPGLPVSAAAYYPAIAFGGGAYLVTYVKPLQLTDLFGVLIQPDGSVGTEFTIYSGTGMQTQPSVAFDGTNFLVVWEHHENDAAPASYDVFGARVSPSGAVLNNSLPVSTAAEAQNYPHVACDGTNCLVIWVDRRNYPGQTYNVSPGPGDIYGTRISNSDELLDGPADTGGLPIATGITANAGYPGLVFTAGSYLATWSRGAFVNNPGGPTGIYGSWVNTDGTVNAASGNAGAAISGPPPGATQLVFIAIANSRNGAIATWLNNAETSGTTKSISGALVFPLAAY